MKRPARAQTRRRPSSRVRTVGRRASSSPGGASSLRRLGLPPQTLQWLVCPECRHDLRARPQGLECLACHRVYPVKDGVPDLLLRERLDPLTRASLDRWNEEWRRQGLPPTGDVEADPAYAAAMAHIRAHGPEGDWGVFLEAGCGSAKNSLVVARERKIPVVGVDACLEACRMARRLLQREGQDGLFVAGDLRRLPFRENVFGYIYAGGSFEHFPETAAAVQEAWRVLKPGGRISATVPVVSLATLTYSQLWGNIPELPVVKPLAEWIHLRLLGGRHLRFGYEKSFLPGTYKRYFRQAGFKHIRHGYLQAYVVLQFLPWRWLKSLGRRLVRWRPFWPMIYVDAEK